MTTIKKPPIYTVNYYGETGAMWSEEFQSWRDAEKFIKRCLDRGDKVFSVDNREPKMATAARKLIHQPRIHD